MSTDADARSIMTGLDGRVAAKQIGDMQSYMTVEDGKLITGTIQDMTPYAERAKERQRTGDFGSSEMRLVADIPLAAIEVYCNANGITLEEWGNDKAHIRRMCNDPALADFRVWPGKL